LRLITADDPRQIARARQYLRDQRRHAPFWINTIVLCKLVWALTASYKFDRPRVVSVILLLLRSDEVALDGKSVVADALYLFRTGKADFADCLIGLSNNLAGCERTATFDRQAAQLDEF
jgi:predicted nucleic-acid-binding protein